jgi:hypothetical protein
MHQRAEYLETGAVDEQMQGFAALNRFRQQCQAIPTTAECRMIRDADVDAKKMRDRSECSFDLGSPSRRTSRNARPVSILRSE